MFTRNRLITLVGSLPTAVVGRFGSTSALTRVIRPIVNRVMPVEARCISVLTGPARGCQLYIYPRSEKFYWTGLHETHVQAAIVANLSPGDVFWDIGAHIGLMSVIAARQIGSEGEVRSFEPMTANRYRLEQTVKVNDFSTITVHGEALAAEEGYAELYSHSASLMWSLDGSASGGSGERVHCSTIDSLAQRIDRKPSLIKIDTEGVEVDVLRGGMRLLREYQPTVIVEFTDSERLHAASELLTMYSFHNIHGKHWLLRPKHRSMRVV